MNNKTVLWILLAVGGYLYLKKNQGAVDGLGANPEFKYPSVVQSLMFPKEKFSEFASVKWAKDHGFKHVPVDPGKESAQFFHIRQFEPKEFSKEKFRTIEFGKSGIKARIGEPKSQAAYDRMSFERSRRRLKLPKKQRAVA